MHEQEEKGQFVRKKNKSRIRRRENRIRVLRKYKTKLAETHRKGPSFHLIETIRKVNLSDRHMPSFGNQADNDTEIFLDNS